MVLCTLQSMKTEKQKGRQFTFLLGSRIWHAYFNSCRTGAIHAYQKRSSTLCTFTPFEENKKVLLAIHRIIDDRMENSVKWRRIGYNLSQRWGCARAVPAPPPSLHSSIGWLQNSIVNLPRDEDVNVLFHSVIYNSVSLSHFSCYTYFLPARMPPS